MKKKTAIISFTFIIIFALLSAFLTFFSFKIPFSTSNWNSFVGGMNFGGDVSDGICSTYTVSYSGDDANAKTNLRKQIYEVLNKYYSEPNVYIQNDNRLFVEIGSEKNFGDDDRIENVMSLIGTKTSFKVYDYFGTSGQITIEHVKSATYEQIAGNNALVIYFDKEGTEMLKAISATGFMYIQIGASDSPIANTSSDQINDGKIYVTGGSKATIVASIINLECEKTGVSLSYVETKNLTATLGNKFAFISLIILVSLCASFVIFMIIRFRVLGVICVLPLSLFVGIYTLFLNILPNIQINTGSLLGIIFSFAIVLASTFMLANGIRGQYREGKSAINSTKFAYKAFLKNVLDFSFILIIPLIILMFVGSSSVNFFGVCLLIGLLCNLFVSLVITKSTFESSICIFGKNLNVLGISKKEEAGDEE